MAHPILDFSQFPVLLHLRILVVLFKEWVPATGALAPKAFWQGFLRLTAIPFLPFELNRLPQTSKK
jgi:hypothetical protein